MKTRKYLILLVAVLLLVTSLAYAQSRLRSRGASVQISNAGAVAITPFTGQSISLAGPTSVSGLLSPAAGVTLGAGSLLTTDSGTATATAGAATLSKQSGVVTSEALTTAAAAAYTLTLTNTVATAASRVLVSVANGTNSAGIPVVSTVTPASGSVVIVIYNLHASAAFNGTIKISYLIVR